MKFQTLASGSKGNCSILLCGNTKILIDAGISYLNIKKKLLEENLYLNDFSAILITHAHSDHIKGLENLIKHTLLNVYIPLKMYPDLQEIVPKDRIVNLEENTYINDVLITLIKTSHDAISVGYLITYLNKSLVYLTDTGYLNRKYFDILKNKNIYFIESNHDEEMLLNGPYPYFLKQRVISDRGHLSNNTASQYLEKLVNINTKYIFLAHLSATNNTFEKAIDATTNKVDTTNITVFIAKQDEVSELVEV